MKRFQLLCDIQNLFAICLKVDFECLVSKLHVLVCFNRLNCRPIWPLGTGSRGGILLKSGGGAQGQRKGDRPAGGGCPETAGQPDQTPRDHQHPDYTSGAAAQQQDCHSQGTNSTDS